MQKLRIFTLGLVLIGCGNDADGTANSSSGGSGGNAGVAGSSNGGSSNGGSSNGGSSSGGSVAVCPKPEGADLTPEEYVPPASTDGCDLSVLTPIQTLSSINLADRTIESESEFASTFSCPPEANSGIDFEHQRLQLVGDMVQGFAPPASTMPTFGWVVEASDAVHLRIYRAGLCNGPMPWQWLWPMLLPSSDLAVVEDQCVNGSTCTGP